MEEVSRQRRRAQKIIGGGLDEPAEFQEVLDVIDEVSRGLSQSAVSEEISLLRSYVSQLLA